MAIKTVVTEKGTVLPLTNLKGKDYLMVAYRIQWFVEQNPHFVVNVNFLVLEKEETVAQVTVTVVDDKRTPIRQAMATKRETKADFSDHLEKAETGALGRALIQLGYGTQYALADLDEGSRLADAPLIDARSAKPQNLAVSTKPAYDTTTAKEVVVQAVQKTVVPEMTYGAEAVAETTKAKPSFRKAKKTEETAATPATVVAAETPKAPSGSNGGWL